MSELHQLFDFLSIRQSSKKYKAIFDALKTILIKRMIQLLRDRRKSKRGRPCTVDWNRFFDCFFQICDNGLKRSYIKDQFQISRSTYYHDFDLITRSKLLVNLYSELIQILHPFQNHAWVEIN